MEAIKLEESVQARFKHAPELVATFRNVGEAGDFPDKMCWFVYSTCELASPRPPVSATQRRALHTATPPKHADAYRGEAVLLRHMRYGLLDVQPPRQTHADAYGREAASLRHMRGSKAGPAPAGRSAGAAEELRARGGAAAGSARPAGGDGRGAGARAAAGAAVAATPFYSGMKASV
jgi:hypothetical protein